jgi:hypothetical protein
LLKVDIDRADCRMAAALSVLRPKVIHVELNPIFPPPFGIAPEYRDGEDWTDHRHFPREALDTCFANNAGCSLSATAALLPDYKLLQVEKEDAVFVRNDLAHIFEPFTSRSLSTHWRLGYFCTYVVYSINRILSKFVKK